jgi:ribonuclease R
VGRTLPGSLPTVDEIVEFIRSSPGPVTPREIARAFHVRGADRRVLRALLREVEEEGLVGRPRGRPERAVHLPPVAELTVAVDDDGEVIGRTDDWRPEAPHPIVRIAEPKSGIAAVGAGDRVLARLTRRDDGTYLAHVMRRLEGAHRRFVGVLSAGPRPHRIEPTDRRIRTAFIVAPGEEGGAQPGELVAAEERPGRHFGLPHARVVERLGPTEGPRVASLIALTAHGIPVPFTRPALVQAERVPEAPVSGRTDLRDIPLVTIDGEDARDFDDAVWAEPDPAPENPGGWHLLVAIADVAWYVRPSDALDQGARERGNSVYFPDRVVPMLPERLSNDLCSLRPKVNRPCLAAHMWIDAKGKILRHAFVRGVMRSAARLTYEQVQAAADGRPDDLTGPLAEPVIAPLYGTYRTLLAARKARGTLDLDLPERLIKLNDAGRIVSISPRERHDSHRVIEEFMIAANVAAAETLERLRMPCMYRIHDQPSETKLDSLREYLGSLGLNLARGGRVTPRTFAQILDRVAGRPEAEMVASAVLRSQAQAEYSPENIGHFGLALRRYAHFTSPIRRYSDLLVHRALIAGLGLGEGGLSAGEEARFTATAEHISATERRAAMAERDAADRLITLFLADRVGAEFAARVTGITRAGVFVNLTETGASGLIPLSTFPGGRPSLDERAGTLTRRPGGVLRLGDRVEVRLLEADKTTASLAFTLIEGKGGAARRGARGRTSKKPLKSNAFRGRRR